MAATTTAPHPEALRRRAARERLWSDALAPLQIAGQRVLDAGTGEGYFTRYIAAREPSQVLSVTCVAEEIPPARARVAEAGGALLDRIEFRVDDLTTLRSVPEAAFDLVVGEFLLAAVAAYSPYREIDVLKTLVRVLKPGGRLLLTGWEVDPAGPLAGPLDGTIRRLFQLRDAIHRVNGVEPFREHPSWWVADRLTELDMPPERIVRHPDVHHDFRWFGRQLHRAVADLPNPALQKGFGTLVDEQLGLVAGHPTFEAGYEFGRIYAVVAVKLAGGLLLSLPKP